MSLPPIIMLTPGFPRDAHDSTCIPALQAYVDHLRQLHGPPAGIIAFQYPFRQAPYTLFDTDIYPCGGKNSGGIYRLNTWRRAVRYAQALLKAHPNAILHSFWLEECTLIAQYLQRWWRRPHIATLMGQDAREHNRYLKKLSLEKMIITGGSPFVADVFQKSTGRTVDYVIPLGLAALPDSAPAEDAPRDIDILGVGALTPLKNYRAFIEIIDMLRDRYPAIRSVIIGEGPQRELLTAEISRRNLTGHITLSGQLPRDSVLAYMRRSRILLHPSQYESQGYVHLEALACGVPVVCQPVGFYEAPGHIFPGRHHNEMAETIARLLAETAPRPAITLIPVSQTVASYMGIYGDTASRDGSRR